MLCTPQILLQIKHWGGGRDAVIIKPPRSPNLFTLNEADYKKTQQEVKSPHCRFSVGLRDILSKTKR